MAKIHDETGMKSDTNRINLKENEIYFHFCICNSRFRIMQFQ